MSRPFVQPTTPLQNFAITAEQRARSLRQRPHCVWLTGLSGAGKSTLANALEQVLHAQGKLTYILDGDNLRRGLSQDLGFSSEDRTEQIRRMAEVARLMMDAGLIVIVSVISPLQSQRAMARHCIGENRFTEVFVDASLGICERRDVKGLYAKARKGLLPDFTGIHSAYEAPITPEVHLNTGESDLDTCLSQMLTAMGNLE